MTRPHLEKAKHKHNQTRGTPKARERGGDQKNTWQRDLEADIKQTGNGWQQLERIAQDRRRWRNVVDGL